MDASLGVERPVVRPVMRPVMRQRMRSKDAYAKESLNWN